MYTAQRFDVTEDNEGNGKADQSWIDFRKSLGKTCTLTMNPFLADAVTEDRIVSLLFASCFHNNFSANGTNDYHPVASIDPRRQVALRTSRRVRQIINTLNTLIGNLKACS